MDEFLSIEKLKAEAAQRCQAQAERDEAAYDERHRQARHHDVLCLVLKQQLDNDGSGPAYGGAFIARMIDVARQAADLAYPPPKAED